MSPLEKLQALQSALSHIPLIQVLLTLAFLHVIWLVGRSLLGKSNKDSNAKESPAGDAASSPAASKTQSSSPPNEEAPSPMKSSGNIKPMGLSSLVQALKPSGAAKTQSILKSSTGTVVKAPKKEPQTQVTVVRADTAHRKGSGESGSTADDEETRAKKAEIIRLTEQIIQTKADYDFETYCKLASPDMSCFEPETKGHLVRGTEFHKFFFVNNQKSAKAFNTMMVNPHVTLLGEDGAFIGYISLTQYVTSTNQIMVKQMEETRVWHRTNGTWRMVHLHRSEGANSRNDLGT